MQRREEEVKLMEEAEMTKLIEDRRREAEEERRRRAQEEAERIARDEELIQRREYERIAEERRLKEHLEYLEQRSREDGHNLALADLAELQSNGTNANTATNGVNNTATLLGLNSSGIDSISTMGGNSSIGLLGNTRGEYSANQMEMRTYMAAGQAKWDNEHHDVKSVSRMPPLTGSVGKTSWHMSQLPTLMDSVADERIHAQDLLSIPKDERAQAEDKLLEQEEMDDVYFRFLRPPRLHQDKFKAAQSKAELKEKKEPKQKKMMKDGIIMEKKEEDNNNDMEEKRPPINPNGSVAIARNNDGKEEKHHRSRSRAGSVIDGNSVPSTPLGINTGDAKRSGGLFSSSTASSTAPGLRSDGPNQRRASVRRKSHGASPLTTATTTSNNNNNNNNGGMNSTTSHISGLASGVVAERGSLANDRTKRLTGGRLEIDTATLKESKLSIQVSDGLMSTTSVPTSPGANGAFTPSSPITSGAGAIGTNSTPSTSSTPSPHGASIRTVRGSTVMSAADAAAIAAAVSSGNTGTASAPTTPIKSNNNTTGGSSSSSSTPTKANRPLSTWGAKTIAVPPTGSSRRSTGIALRTSEHKKTGLKLIYWVDLAISAIEIENPFLIGYPTVYVEVHRSRQSIAERVAVTDNATGTLNPCWTPLILSVDDLCNMQLDRSIMFKCYAPNRMDGRTLIGECQTSLAKIQSNIGGRFPIINPEKEKKLGSAYKNSGYFRFNQAELCVNASRAAVRYPGPNVAHTKTPIYERLTECVIRLWVRCTSLVYQRSYGVIWTRNIPDPTLQFHRRQPDGTWSKDPVFTTEVQYETENPKFNVLVVKLHTLCFGEYASLLIIPANSHTDFDSPTDSCLALHTYGIS
jgi:hypothetical protein